MVHHHALSVGQDSNPQSVHAVHAHHHVQFVHHHQHVLHAIQDIKYQTVPVQLNQLLVQIQPKPYSLD